MGVPLLGVPRISLDKICFKSSIGTLLEAKKMCWDMATKPCEYNGFPATQSCSEEMNGNDID